jgi:hypothetical protein
LTGSSKRSACIFTRCCALWFLCGGATQTQQTTCKNAEQRTGQNNDQAGRGAYGKAEMMKDGFTTSHESNSFSCKGAAIVLTPFQLSDFFESTFDNFFHQD